MPQPDDSYYTVGLWLLGKNKAGKSDLPQLLLGWLVKLFFLPLMIVYFSRNINTLTDHTQTWEYITLSFKHTYDYLFILLFTIDLVYVCIGYILTLKLFDSQIRSTEPTLLGWFSAIICYQPFMGSLSALYFVYNMDNYSWGAWLEEGSVLYVLWGSLILVCLFIYAMSSVVFGIRFSNLTNRGIITNGPYRYSKHPAYLSKSISWWLISIPFISQANNAGEIIRSCLMLLLINYIYYLRAKTEESHLMVDERYRDYVQWVRENGLFSRVARLWSR